MLIILYAIGFGLFGYLCGSLPFAVWITRLVKGVDVRAAGSGHATTTNVIRQAGLLPGAAVFILAPDLPALFIEQARLILQLGFAHGRRLEPLRAAELTVVLVAGLGLRRVARVVRRKTLFPAWALQGSIAYTGTLALGEAALAYFSSTSR